jgi:hypothetical protein
VDWAQWEAAQAVVEEEDLALAQVLLSQDQVVQAVVDLLLVSVLLVGMAAQGPWGVEAEQMAPLLAQDLFLAEVALVQQTTHMAEMGPMEW